MPQPSPSPGSSDSTAALRARIEAHLTHETGAPATVRALSPLPGGACQENYVVEVTLGAGPLAGDRRLALRSDSKTSLPGSLGRAAEYGVVRAAAGAGVKTPQAHYLAHGLIREGADAYFLDWIEGDAIGRRVVSHPRLETARQLLPAQLAAELARIHSINPTTHPDLFQSRQDGFSGPDPVESTLALLRRMLDGLGEAHPALELGTRWLSDNRPPPGEVTLVHGDFRTGNFMVNEAGLAGILDWEFSRFSSPVEDVGWLCVRDWRFGKLDRPAGGFASRAQMAEAYEKASGRKLTPQLIHYWEVMGNVRWAAGSLHQGERYLAGDHDIELIAIARRAVEMEWEALRLIEKGY